MTRPTKGIELKQHVNKRLADYAKGTKAYRAQTSSIRLRRSMQIGSLAVVAPLVASVGDAQAQVNCFTGPGTVSFANSTNLTVGPMQFSMLAIGSALYVIHGVGNWMVTSGGDFAEGLNDSGYALWTNEATSALLCAPGSFGAFCPTDGPRWLYSTGNPSGFVELHVTSLAGNSAVVDVGYVQTGSIHAGECPIVLPVELVSFNAVIDGGSVRLGWETASELQNAGFEIQRATSTREFSRLGFVDGHGTSDLPNRYAWTDDTTEPNIHYKYRLKQIDFDGSSSFSSLVEVFTEDPSDVALGEFYPNPGRNGRARLNVNVAEPVQATIDVFDARGALVTSNARRLNAGQNRLTVKTSELADGPHFARISVGDRVQYRRLVVMH